MLSYIFQEDSLIPTQAVLNAVNIPVVHANKKQEGLVGNTHNSVSFFKKKIDNVYLYQV